MSNFGSKRLLNRPKFGNDADLLHILRRLDGATYGAYRQVIGQWDYGRFKVAIDRIQADSYAPPSSVRILLSPTAMNLPSELLETIDTRLAVGDFLNRSFGRNILEHANSTGKEPALSIARVSPEILLRSAVNVQPNQVELRIQVQMPARGRRILGHQAAEIFDVDLVEIAANTLDFTNQTYLAELTKHVQTLVDHRTLQRILEERNWIAFVANGAVLPRRSGVSQAPLSNALPFESPASLLQSVELPYAGTVTGMAIPAGITVIVGGGYHGKSTLLQAIQRGVYPHVPGDGRELVATLPEAMKVRAFDGRPVEKVDVSPFINHLPSLAETTRFSSQNASGSTSQAAAIMEAIEAGATALLLDEDTSATNLLIRDERMRRLVSNDQEPITPLVDRIRALWRARKVSVVLVMGGSGDYLDAADFVLQMDSYRCLDVTERAKYLCSELPRQITDVDEFAKPTTRCPLRLRKTSNRPKTKASGTSQFALDRQSVDVTDVEQIVDAGQTLAIAWAVRGVLEQLADARTPLPKLLEDLERRLDQGGLDALVQFGVQPSPAFLVRPRRLDVAAAINRFRALEIT